MRAAVYHGVRDIRIQDVAEPVLGPGQVKIKVAHNGVCGSDLHEYFAAATFVPTEPHPQTGIQAPVIIGHEFAGTVLEAAPDVTSVRPGDRAAIRPTYSCGQCTSCEAGLPNICQMLAFHGASAPGGGLSEYTVVNVDMVHILPPNVSLELGALVEPMTVAHHAVARAELTDKDTAVIIGSGAIGLGLWFALRARGVEKIVISETSPRRRQAAADLGATVVVDPRVDELADTVRKISDNKGATAVFDAAGVGAAFTQGLSVLAPRGRLVVVGVHERPFDFNPTQLLMQETTILGSMVYTDSEFDEVIANMAAGHYDTCGWVEHLGLDELTSAFDLLREGQRMKILIDL